MRTLYKLLLGALPLILGSLAAVSTQAQTPQYFFQGGTSNNSFPLNSNTSNKVQWVYVPSTHFPTAPSGLITTVYFKSVNAVTSATFTNLTIKLGTDTLTQFAAGVQPWVAGLTTVYSAPTTAFSNLAAGSWFSVTLPTPYLFNASQSLIVEMSQTAYTGGISLVQESITGDVARQWGLVTNPTTANSGPGRANFGFDWLPACAVPTALTDVAASYSANIAWTGSTSTNQGYEYVVSTSPTLPTGPGISATGTGVSLSGLTPNTTYYYFVRTVCNATDYSAYVGDSFKTCNPPASSFIAVGSPFPASATICQGDTATLKAPGGAGNTYLYLLNGAVTGTGATNDSVLRVMQGGSYRVVVTNAAGCYDTSAAAGVTVTVNPLPAPVVAPTAVPNQMSTTQFSSYQWRLAGVPIPLATQQVYTAPVSGAYSVTVTNSAGCRATSSSYNLTVTTSVNEAKGAAAVRVFPNPTTGVLFIESARPVSAQVRAVDGRVVNEVKNAKSVDLVRLPAGVYTLRLISAEGSVLLTERVRKMN